MVAATLTVELNKLGRNSLFCYFDQGGVLHSKETTLESVDLMVVVCCEPPNKTLTKLIHIARLRLLLTFDTPFCITYAYGVLKSDLKSAYNHIIVNFDANDDGRHLHNNLLQLMEKNALAENVSYMTYVTLKADDFQCSSLIEFAKKTAAAHSVLAKDILRIISA